MGWKIVRDRHRDVLEGQISGQWRVSPDPVSALVKKLGEEYGEFTENRDPGELYDLLDVLLELRYLLDVDQAVYALHREKQGRLGSFANHIEWHPNPALDAP
jgi:predicted house-cleaning noncanonical NTP pyrophosphatase (MazG superfamily)